MFAAGAPVHLVPSSGWDPSSPHNLSVCLIVFNSFIPSVQAAKAGERGRYHLGLWHFPHHRDICMNRVFQVGQATSLFLKLYSQ